MILSSVENDSNWTNMLRKMDFQIVVSERDVVRKESIITTIGFMRAVSKTSPVRDAFPLY